MLINSHMDTLVVNAMHQYNVAASRMGLPSRTKAVEKLADDLSKCSDNVKVSNCLHLWALRSCHDTVSRTFKTPWATRAKRCTASRMPTTTTFRRSSTRYLGPTPASRARRS